MVSTVKVRKALKPYLWHAFLALGVALSGCSSQPVVPTAATTKPAPLPEVVKVADRDFESDTLYALLVAEIAGDRDRFDVMLSNYVQQARATNDLEVTARASRVARYLNVHDASLEMALLWTELEPGNLEAHFNATVELIEANQLLAALDHAELLAQHVDASGLDAIAARAVQIDDRELTEALLARYLELKPRLAPHVPLSIGLSLLYQQAGQLEAALASARDAQRADRDSFQASAQGIRVLEQMGNKQQALNELGALVERFPDNHRLRLQYARSLVREDLVAAEHQFLTLLNAKPEDPDLTLTVALIQYELKKYPEATEHFLQLAEDDRRKDTVHAYLGRILLAQGDPQAAIAHLQAVRAGTDLLPSLAKLSELYLEQGEERLALSHLQQQIEQNELEPDIREGIILLRSSVLNRAGQHQAAIDSLSEALTDAPGAPGLLYARAILHAEQAELAHAERDLKEVLTEHPDNAAALNALGYTLADKTDRLDEAYEYIKRAYELAPEDPAVIDSLGWVEYRRGNREVALKLLTQAMTIMPDPEIAAHLGEVLWVSGEQKLAREVWREGFKVSPNNPIIQETMERLITGEEP